MNKRIVLTILLFLLSPPLLKSFAQQYPYNDSIYAYESPIYNKKYPWRASALTFGINVGVWAFNRYIANEEFARISINTFKDNIKHGFVWDNDQFSTNLFAHPYHGSLYFNAARSNGYSFWESTPFTFVGSLMWEFAAEREPAAINDLMATTIGGMALGEMTHRLSSLVLDDSKRGKERIFREFLGTIICPNRGLNRMISGKMFKVKHSFYKYHDYNQIPIKFSISTGLRFLADDNHLFKGEYNPYVQFNINYGDAFGTENNSPYNYFTANITFGLSANQPLINRVSLTGKLWGKSIRYKDKVDMTYGVFQYFNYYDSEKVIDDSENIPYKISEAASFGPGIIYKFKVKKNSFNIEQSTFLGAIILGGGLTDYYNVIERNYNMGSGYSVKNSTILDFGKRGSFKTDFNLYQIFTWKGYKDEELDEKNPLYLNSQGDKGNTLFMVISPKLEIRFTEKIRVNIENSYYIRKTHYSRRKDVFFRTYETKLGLLYNF